MKTLAEQLDCAKRELELRRQCYPGWVQSRRMTPEKSNHELACMEAIVATLEKQVLLAEISEEMKGEEG